MEEPPSRCEGLDAHDMPVTTLGEEREINAFFRLDSAEIIDGLARASAQAAGSTAGRQMDTREVFLALRQLRNRW